jgi:hypothetical protein
VQLPESLDSGIEREKGGNMQGEVGWLLAFGFWLLAFGFWLLAFGFWDQMVRYFKCRAFLIHIQGSV